MSTTWLFYLAMILMGGSPWLGLALLVFAIYGSEAWWRGRLWRPWGRVEAWMRIRELRAKLQINPHDLTLRADLGRLLVERGRHAEAREHLEQVCERGKTLAVPAWHLGQAQLKLGDFEAGRASIERAVSLRKDVGYGQPMMDVGDFLFGRGRLPDALAYYERGLAVHGGSIEGRYKLGRCRLATGDVAGARAAFDDAITSYDASPKFKRSQDRAWRWRAWWWRRK